MEKEAEIEKLKKECIEFCKKSPLYKEGTFPVFGRGSLNAEIMLVGEAPGYNESITGKPFCGAAGKILDELLEYAEWDILPPLPGSQAFLDQGRDLFGHRGFCRGLHLLTFALDSVRRLCGNREHANDGEKREAGRDCS